MLVKIFSLAILLITGINSTFADQSTLFKTSIRKDEFMLYIPSVKFGAKSIGNARLKLEDDGRFIVRNFVNLSDEETDILNFLQDIPCSPLGNLEKVSAFLAYSKNATPYCLQLGVLSTVEGGSVFYYLLIDNNSMQYIADTRLDGFGQCCFHEFGSLNTMQLGVYENGEFIEVLIQSELDLDLEYILRVPDPDGFIYEF